MITWQQIEDDIIYSKLLGVEISNKFYINVLEYYFSDISLIMDYDGQHYYKNSLDVSKYSMDILYMRSDFEDYIEYKYSISRYVLYDLVHHFLLYKHNIDISVG